MTVYYVGDLFGTTDAATAERYSRAGFRVTAVSGGDDR